MIETNLSTADTSAIEEESVSIAFGKLIDPKQQEFLNFVLEQYVKSGVEELDDQKLPELLELKYNALADAKAQLGSIPKIRETFIGFQKWLYGEVG